MKRIAVARLFHEASSFLPKKTTLVDWFHAIYWVASQKSGTNALSLQ